MGTAVWGLKRPNVRRGRCQGRAFRKTGHRLRKSQPWSMRAQSCGMSWQSWVPLGCAHCRWLSFLSSPGKCLLPVYLLHPPFLQSSRSISSIHTFIHPLTPSTFSPVYLYTQIFMWQCIRACTHAPIHACMHPSMHECIHPASINVFLPIQQVCTHPATHTWIRPSISLSSIINLFISSFSNFL